MNLTERVRRTRTIRVAAWAVTVVCAAGLVVEVADALPAGTPPVLPVTITPSSGDSGTDFNLGFDEFQACPGDATEDYRWGTFVVPISQDPAVLTFDGSGLPVGEAPSIPLFNTSASPILQQLPSLGTGAIGIADIDFDFARPGLDILTTGDYWLGIACQLPNDDFQVENVKYWSTAITITQQSGAGPNNFVWEVATPPETTTTTTTTVVDDTTTTTAPGEGTTTTTVDDGSTTSTTIADGAAEGVTVDPASVAPGETFTVTYDDCEENEAVTFSFEKADQTDTCTAGAALGIRRPQQTAGATAAAEFTAPTEPGTYEGTAIGSVTQETVTFSVTVTSATATTAAASTATTFPTGTTPVFGGSTQTGSGGQLVATGSSSMSIVVWAVLLLVFGRMAILLGRKPKVLPPVGA